VPDTRSRPEPLKVASADRSSIERDPESDARRRAGPILRIPGSSTGCSSSGITLTISITAERTPPHFRPGVRYPTLLHIHGGPVSQFDFRFYFVAQLFAALAWDTSTVVETRLYPSPESGVLKT
jgi:hypothetical protein